MKKLTKFVLLLTLVAISATLLVACVPKDIKDIKKNLEKADYDVEMGGFYYSYEIFCYLGIEIEDYDGKELYAEDDDCEDAILVLSFDKSKDANEVYKVIKNNPTYVKVASSYMITTGGDDNLDIEFGKRGNIIYIGTEQAIKDCQG